jgi:hypothetical protein
MKIQFLINKIKSYRSRNNLFYILGRFKLIRQLTKKFRALVNKRKIIIHSNNNHLTDQVDLSNILEKLNKEGYCEGLKLNKDVLDKLLLLSSSSDYIDSNNRIFKSIKSIDEYNNKNNKPCCLLKLTNVELNKLANNISRDKYLLNLVNNYLGYINKIESKVQWSTVCNTTNDWREENGQTVTYHYDVHDLNFVYVFFYLTDCNVSSGAHQIIKGSHVKKNFFTHLVGSVKQTEKDLKQYFIEDKFITIEGQKGSGFIEDTSCFHRALPPLDKPRLTLQIRYS